MSEGQAPKVEGFKLTSFQRHSILFICFLLYMINFMDRQVLSVVLEPMKHDLALSDTQAGLLQSGFFLSMALLTVPISYLVDRWSRRKALSLMAVIWSVSTYVTGLGKSFIGVLAPRVLTGIGEAGFPPAGTAMISAAYPPRTRSRVLGIFNAAIPLGAALGTILGGYLAQKYGSWRAPFYVFAVPGVILGIAALFLKDYKTVRETDETGKAKTAASSVATLFKTPTLRWLYLGYAMQLAMTMAFIVWGPAFLMRSQNLPVDKAGAIMGGIGLLGIIGAPLGGVIADLWQKKNPRGRIYTAMTAILISSVLLALAMYFDFAGIGLVFGAVLGVFLVMGIPAVNSVSQDVVTPGLKGISWGIAGLVAMLLGAAWAPSAVGAISDSIGGGAAGLKYAMMLMTICGVVAAVLFWLASKPYPADLAKVEGASLEYE
jgi:MFS family permease